MYIYRHHTADNLIDMDDSTGRWVPVDEDDDDPIFVGSMSIVLRADFEVRGSYTIENEKRCCFYWTDDSELVFRTPDNQRISFFRRERGGRLIDVMPQIRVNLQPSMYGDGRVVPDMSTFSLIDKADKKIFEISYDSNRYLQYYLGNFTFVPDEDLRDWDFFVAVKRAVEELRIIAQSCAAISTDKPNSVTTPVDIILAETGSASPRAGLWVACHNLRARCKLAVGDKLPDVDGRHETWVWVGTETT